MYTIVHIARHIATEFQDLTKLYVSLGEDITLAELGEAFTICSELPNLKKIEYVTELVDL